MRTLRIDLETYSGTDIKLGVYRYVEDPDFEVMLFGYAYDDEPVTVIDLACGEAIPESIIDDLWNSNVEKTAFNAAFERVCLTEHFGRKLPIEQWKCTSVLALQHGLPQRLDQVGPVIGLPKDKLKMSVGSKLIRKFCCPVKPTKKHPSARWYPHEAPEDWQTFKDYCARDVETERAVARRLSKNTIPAVEWRAYWMDQRINDRGIRVDLELVRRAVAADTVAKERITKRLVAITGLTNPNSVKQLKTWLEDETFLTIDSMAKDHIPGIIKDASNSVITEVLKLRLEVSKTSVKKYKAMANMVCADGRIHGLLQFYGANRTGRWAGRGVQIHNLPKSTLHQGSKKNPHDDLDLARQALLTLGADEIELLFGNVPDTLSQLIRTAFAPNPGGHYLVIDFSAIEARALAWLAGEMWRIEVFKTHGKIYEASAAAMFNVPIESIDKGNPLRQKGKVSELALGYQGGPGALITMGALKMGLTEEELPPLVKTWRKANPNIVNLWWDVDRAAKAAVITRQTQEVLVGPKKNFKLVFRATTHFLFIKLPSGRELAYVNPKIEIEEGFGEGVTYEGLDQETKQWGRTKSYGGKWVENICQAFCRDLLRDAMLATEDEGYDICAHVHDEEIVEFYGDDPQGALEHCEEIMGRESLWAPGLPLRGDGFVSRYYKKGD